MQLETLAKIISVQTSESSASRQEDVKMEYLKKVPTPEHLLDNLYNYSANRFATVNSKLTDILRSEIPLEHPDFNDVMR